MYGIVRADGGYGNARVGDRFVYDMGPIAGDVLLDLGPISRQSSRDLWGQRRVCEGKGGGTGGAHWGYKWSSNTRQMERRRLSNK